MRQLCAGWHSSSKTLRGWAQDCNYECSLVLLLSKPGAAENEEAKLPTNIVINYCNTTYNLCG